MALSHPCRADLVEDIVQTTCSNIHDVVLEIGERYSELFSGGKPSEKTSDDDVHRVASKPLRNPDRLAERRIREPH